MIRYGLLIFGVALAHVTLVQAEEEHEMQHQSVREYREGERKHHEFREHDYHHFDHEERRIWQGGRWNNTCFAGRCGWWWFAGGQWYFYDRPIYPYPMVVSAFTYTEPVIVAPAPYAPTPVVLSPPLRVAPPPQFWYYCDNPAGYYPNVAICNTQFRQVTVPQPPH